MGTMTTAAPVLLVTVAAAPAAVVAALGGARWITGRRASERFVSRSAAAAFGYAALVSAGLLILQARGGAGTDLHAELGAWFAVEHYEFPVVLLGDRLSLIFALFSSLLLWTVASFSGRYLHREEGFHRFFLMLTLFGMGVLIVVLGASLEVLFFGWELVGLTSALLIAFFHERRGPVENGLRTFVTYRFCDIGLLAAAVWLHQAVGGTSFLHSTGTSWAMLPVPLDGFDALVIGLLLVWASIGKAAQFPLGGWLPRAMEGPTPSSAIFYGAISVHLGPYLLLRAAPIFEASDVARLCVIVIGILTAGHATFVGRVQTDIKCALAYASMTQLGIIFVEIGLGLYWLAVVHIVGHATLRSLQILRSPSLLHDHHHLEQAMGQTLPRSGGHLEVLVPRRFQPWLYRTALERGYLDALIIDRVLGAFRRSLLAVDALDRRFTGWLAGERSTTDVTSRAVAARDGSEEAA